MVSQTHPLLWGPPVGLVTRGKEKLVKSRKTALGAFRKKGRKHSEISPSPLNPLFQKKAVSRGQCKTVIARDTHRDTLQVQPPGEGRTLLIDHRRLKCPHPPPPEGSLGYCMCPQKATITKHSKSG